MKQFKILWLLISIALYSAGQVTPKQTKIGIKPGNGVVLQYAGKMSGPINLNIDAHVDIDSSIGIRYEVLIKRGLTAVVHTGLFYKFSNPYQTIFYNFLTHESTINDDTTADTGSMVKVVGTEEVDSFNCTRLTEIKKSDHQTTYYWVSEEVPGFSKIINTLASISSDLPGMAINGSIFQWGGLVQMKSTYTDLSKGGSMNFDLHLSHWSTNVGLPSGDFDVPSN